MTRFPLLLLAGAVLLVSAPATAQVNATDINCAVNSSSGSPTAAPNGHIVWPDDGDPNTPAWEFDFSRPGNSITADGTGLEIRDVYYDGRLVMKRGNVPVLNVEYDPGAGCGCFRDWQDNEVNFEADGVDPVNTCFAQSTPGTVRTTCEVNQVPECTGDSNDPRCGDDPGSFFGVSVENYDNQELVLTMNTRAGWYRYRMKWHFYADGRIWPEYSFSAASATCTDADHRHHAYWRFDFDLEGTPNNDIVRERVPGGAGTIFETEADRTWGNPQDGIYWTVEDAETQRGYEIVPSREDRQLPIDAFSKTDALILKYDPTEMDDGSFGCAIDYDSEQNGESIVGEDIVFWYRSSALHVGGNPWECDIVGPTLRPVNFSVDQNEPGVPLGGYKLDTAGPNPFTPFTSVRFRIPEAGTVRLALYDALGREVRTLFDGDVAGNRDEVVRVDGAFLPAGTYTVRMESGGRQMTTRIVLVR